MQQDPIIRNTRLTRFIKGYVILNVITLPLSLLITFFIGIMGGSTPHGGVLSHPFLLAAAFVYGAPLLTVICILLVAKLFDALLRLTPLNSDQLSLPGLLFASIVFVVLGNILVDDLYQFRQGNFGISFIALLFVCALLGIVHACAGIRLPIVSKWFENK